MDMGMSSTLSLPGSFCVMTKAFLLFFSEEDGSAKRTPRAPAFDPLLFCKEGFEEDLGDNGSEEESENCDRFSKKQSFFPLIFLESDVFWENDELSSLISKKKQTHVCFSGEISDGSLMMARKEVVIKWILSVKAHCGFSSLTAILAECKGTLFLFHQSLSHSSSSSIRDVNRLDLVPLHKKWNNCKLFPSLSTPRSRSDNLGLIKTWGIYSEQLHRWISFPWWQSI